MTNAPKDKKAPLGKGAKAARKGSAGKTESKLSQQPSPRKRTAEARAGSSIQTLAENLSTPATTPPSATDTLVEESQAARDERYYEAVGRRKRATARVRLHTARLQDSAEAGNITVNNQPYKTYFPTERLQLLVEEPLRKLKSLNRFRATVRVSGGGIHGQAEAARHGLARALVNFDANFRKRLKRAGYLRRDPREKERRKYGLKKARRAPQWQKR